MRLNSAPALRPLLPPIQTARQYSWIKLRADLRAGLTVSVVELPQAMAYALIAGVPPQYGIYTSIIQGLLGALFSSSQHLASGPTNTQSLLIASTLARLGGTPDSYLPMVFALTLMKGVMQLAFAAARLGDMVRYVSRSVIVGVAAGAGVLIAVGQVPALLGIELSTTPPRLPSVLGAFERMVPHLGQINFRAVIIAVASLSVLLGLRMAWRLLPASFLAIVLGALIVLIMGWTDTQVQLIGELPRALPAISVPNLDWATAEALLSGALALAVLGLLETVAIGKSIATHTDERLNPNQEFFAQGLSNTIASFFQCIPGSGSFSRSALGFAAGAQTRFASVFNALFVAGIFLLLARQARYVPQASLAAVLLVIAFRLIDWRYIPRIARASRADVAVCLVTFVATLVTPLQYAIFIGIFVNIGIYLRQASRLHLAEMVQHPGGGAFLERPVRDASGRSRVIFLQVEGDLFFAVADELEERLAQLLRSGVRVVILRMKRTHSIDATVLHSLEHVARSFRAAGGHLILCGLRPQLMGVLDSFGLIDLLGRENVFETSEGIFVSAKKALQRSRQLVGASLDTDKLTSDIEAEQLTYEI